MTADLRLGLAGNIADLPPALPQAVAAENIRFEAICDPNGSGAETAVRTYGARWPFTDLEQMLKESEPDAVILAVSAPQRTGWIKTCLRYRRPVLVLGSPATTVAECRALAKAARAVNRQVMVGLPQRFGPAGQRLRRILESGRLGPLADADVLISRPGSPQTDDNAALALPFDLMFEAADRLLSCGLQPTKIMAVQRTYGHVGAVMTCACGAMASIRVHCSGSSESAGSRLELRSDDGGLLVLEDDVNLDCRVGSQWVARHHPRFGVAADPRIECGYTGMISAFAGALRQQQGVPYGLPSATHAVTLARAIFKAASTGKTVTLTKGGE